MQLRGKSALVTGASSGIGRACATTLAAHGVRLVLTGRRRAALEDTASSAGGGEIIEADLEEPESLAQLCDRVLSGTEVLDILIHNAGVGLYGPSYSTDPEYARRLLALNLLAPVEITRRLLPIMPRGGTVVTVSSIAGMVPVPGLGVYSASKHALNAYADILRMETRSRGIRVMNVCPGPVETEFKKNLLGRSRQPPNLGQRFSITAEDCARAIHRGLQKNKRTVVIPRINWTAVAAQRLFPGTLHRLIARMAPSDNTI